MKKLISLLCAVVFLSACTPASNQPSQQGQSDQEKLTIGFVGPLTGDAASIGQDLKVATELYFEQNPEWAGKQVEVIYEDGQCNGQDAASAAQKLINVDDVSFIIGGVCSGETLGIAPIAERNKVILYTPGSSSPEISGVGRFTFRGAPSDVASSDLMTDLMNGTFTKVALITQNNDYSQAYRAELQQKLPAAGVEILVDEAFNSGTTDFKSILQKVKDSEAEVLLNIPGEIAPGGFITKQARELGIELPVYGGDVLAGTEYFEVAKDAAEGTTIVIASADKTKPGVMEVLDAFEAKQGRPTVVEAYVLLLWDELNIMSQAIQEVGMDTEAIVTYLEEMPPYDGLGGVTDFDENHDANILPNVMVAKDGAFVIKE